MLEEEYLYTLITTIIIQLSPRRIGYHWLKIEVVTYYAAFFSIASKLHVHDLGINLSKKLFWKILQIVLK